MSLGECAQCDKDAPDTGLYNQSPATIFEEPCSRGGRSKKRLGFPGPFRSRKDDELTSDAALRPPIACYVWAPENLFEMCHWRLKRNRYDVRRPSLPDEEWKGVDTLFEQVWPAANLSVILVLCEESAEKTGKFLYIYLEPFANVVIALGYAEKKASITADAELWSPTFKPAFMTLIGDVERWLQQGEITEALLFSIQKSRQILQFVC